MSDKVKPMSNSEYEIKSLDPNKIHLVEIIADTTGLFSDIVEKINGMIKSNGVRNNIIYSHRPVDKETGKPMESNIKIKTND